MSSVTARGLLLKHFYQSIGQQVRLEIGTDSTACRGMALRHGVGKIRHLENKYLWVQEGIRRKLATLEKVGWIRDAAGPRFDRIELQVRVHLAAITDDRRGLAEAFGPALGLGPEEAMASPHALAGSVSEIVEQCLERRERYGISYVMVSMRSTEAFAPVVARLAGGRHTR